MSDQDDKWANQWQQLLTRCHGEEVEANAGFKSRLLGQLKQRTAENALLSSESTEVEQTEQVGSDEQWSRLLQHAYVPCRPSERFKSSLLAEMAAKNSSAATEEEAIASILQTIEPAEPRREFQTRLLINMKQRQRAAINQRKSSRRRTLFMSAMSGMAAAAAVLFVVWAQPMSTTAPVTDQFAPATTTMASGGGAVFSTPMRMASSDAVLATFNDSSSSSSRSIPNGLALASFGDYKVDDIFATSPLPTTMRGIGMEINHGDGWQPMDETLISQVTPGISLRPITDSETSGLGFGDGSTVHMRPNSVIETTGQGISVRQGTMTVNVPANADGRFYMHFPARDIAVEPGTMMAVSVASPDEYASGGAPAPVVKVLDGGMAVAKGRGGSGILLANQVYQLDNYITPDLPGRPLCATECEELQNTFMQPTAQPAQSYSPAQLVSSGGQTTPYRPTASPVGYVKRGTRWVARSYDNEPTIKIPYLSDAYFAFANARRDLSVGLTLGSEVILDGGDGNFYEIQK